MPKSNNKLSTGSVFLDILLITIMIVITIVIIRQHYLFGYCKEYSSIDGLNHHVQCNYKDRTQAADLLAKLNDTAEKLIAHLKNKYNNRNDDRGNLTKRLDKRYRGSSRLVETDPNNYWGDTSYTLDKGYLVSMCLRKSKDKKLNDFHKLNTLRFVLIHELTHIAANVQQHPPRFWDVFKWLLQEAVEANLYIPIEYDKDPVKDYCAKMDINYSPYYDQSLENICCDK